MHGRAGFDLLRHRILLRCRSRKATTDYGTEPITGQTRYVITRPVSAVFRWHPYVCELQPGHPGPHAVQLQESVQTGQALERRSARAGGTALLPGHVPRA